MRKEAICFTSFFTEEECLKICQYLDRDAHPQLIDVPANVTKSANTKLIPWPKAQHYLSNLKILVLKTNETEFKFDVDDFGSTNTINYNVYDSKYAGQYDWHGDAMDTHPTKDSKLTVVVSLSSNYEGGDLEFFINKPRPINELRTAGTVLIFPSYIQHRVTPVTKGVRKTLSLWIEGPNFR